MESKAGRDGLQQCLAGMIGLEMRIDEMLTRTPPAVEEYLEAPTVVRRPRAHSNAERAGLREGDTVLAVDGREVRSYQDMLDRMRDRQPGEETRLRVRRRAGDVQDLVVTR